MCLTPTLRSSPPHLPLNPRKTSFLNNPTFSLPCLTPHKPIKRGCRQSGLCRAEFSHDAPFAAAIGACMLTSLAFPVTEVRDDQSDAALDTTDARFAVMGIISFIPYFNWLSWVFAWLDTGNRRYAIYALVYLAPYLRSFDSVWIPTIFHDKKWSIAADVFGINNQYFQKHRKIAFISALIEMNSRNNSFISGLIRSNLSLSPEEGWLPMASIIFGIIHVQLESSIRNGDIQGLQLFSEAAKHFKWISRHKDVYHDDEDHEETSERRQESPAELQPGKQQVRDEVRRWDVAASRDKEHSRSDWDGDDSRVEK